MSILLVSVFCGSGGAICTIGWRVLLLGEIFAPVVEST